MMDDLSDTEKEIIGRILRDERVRNVAVEYYGLIALEKLEKALSKDVRTAKNGVGLV